MTNLTVLMVEDDPVVQHVHTYMLNKLGYQAEIAATGSEALQMIQQNPPYPLVFVDIGLPDISGFDLIAKIRAHYAELALPVAIVALTGYIGAEEKAECLKAGANSIIYKPVVMDTLREILAGYNVSVDYGASRT